MQPRTKLAEDGLRERKKKQTRAQIIEVALDLCERQGFEATTVEQIAAAADVSPRTVNRYFPTKEDIVLGPIVDFLTASIEIMENLPTGGSELFALRDSYLILIDRIVQAGEPISFETFQQMHRVVRESPAVSARSREFGEVKTNVLTATVAKRLGTSPDDLSVRLIMATWSAIVHTAMDGCDDSSPESCINSVSEAFDAFQTICQPR